MHQGETHKFVFILFSAFLFESATRNTAWELGHVFSSAGKQLSVFHLFIQVPLLFLLLQFYLNLVSHERYGQTAVLTTLSTRLRVPTYVIIFLKKQYCTNPQLCLLRQFFSTGKIISYSLFYFLQERFFPIYRYIGTWFQHDFLSWDS